MSDVDWDKLRDELVEAIMAILRATHQTCQRKTETYEDAPERAPSG